MATNENPASHLPSGGLKEGFDVGESVNGGINAPDDPMGAFPQIHAWVCKPCGKLLGLVDPAKPVPTCCGTKEFTAVIDARTARVHRKSGRVVAATHI